MTGLRIGREQPPNRGCIGLLSTSQYLTHIPVLTSLIEKLAESGYEVRVFAPSQPVLTSRVNPDLVQYAGNPWVWEGRGAARLLRQRRYLQLWALKERLRRRYTAMVVADSVATGLASLWQPIFRVPQIYSSLELLLLQDLPAQAITLRRYHRILARYLPGCRHYLEFDPVRGARLAAEFNLALDKMIYIPNSWRRLPLQPKTGALRRMFGLSATDRILICAGNLGPGFGIEDILASVSAWPAHWKLVLHSSFGAQVNPRIAFELELIRRLAPPGRVWLTPPDQAPGAYWDLLADADAGIAFYTRNGDEWGWLTNNQLMGYASGKINAYLRAGLPVITNRYTNLGEMLVEPEQAGVVVESAAEIPAALQAIDAGGAAMARRARQAYEHRLDPEPGLEQLLGAIRSL